MEAKLHSGDAYYYNQAYVSLRTFGVTVCYNKLCNTRPFTAKSFPFLKSSVAPNTCTHRAAQSSITQFRPQCQKRHLRSVAMPNIYKKNTTKLDYVTTSLFRVVSHVLYTRFCLFSWSPASLVVNAEITSSSTTSCNERLVDLAESLGRRGTQLKVCH